MTHALRTLVTLCLAAATSAGALGSPGQAIDLQFQWVEGEEFTYKFTHDTYAEWFPEHSVREIVNEVRRFRIDGISPDGTATVEVFLESIRLDLESRTDSLTESVLYDSRLAHQRTPEAQRLAEAMEALVGQTTTAVIDRTGAVGRVTGMPSVWPEYMEVNGRYGYADALRHLMDPAALPAKLAQYFSYLPGRVVTRGDSWQTEHRWPYPDFEGMSVANTLTLRRVTPSKSGDLATIDLARTFSIGQAGPGRVRLRDSSGKGEILFDPARRRVTRVTSESRISADIGRTGPSTVRILVGSKTTVELLER